MGPGLGLQVTLASQVSATVGQSLFRIPVEVFIHNPTEQLVSFLKWGSPIDPRAEILGVFTVCDTGSGETLPMKTINISRKLPASYEDLVEISAGQTLEKIVYLTVPQLEKDHEYSVHAQGIWHAIWAKPMAHFRTSDLEKLAGAKRGEFLSNSTSFKAQ